MDMIPSVPSLFVQINLFKWTFCYQPTFDLNSLSWGRSQY